MKELDDGVEYFDGDPVKLYEGRFSGSFPLDQDGVGLSTGDIVCYMVTARVDNPKFSYDRKSGDLKRSNTLKVEDAVQLSVDRAKFLLDAVNRKVNGINDGIIEIGVAPQPAEAELWDGTEFVKVPQSPSQLEELFLDSFTEVS